MKRTCNAALVAVALITLATPASASSLGVGPRDAGIEHRWKVVKEVEAQFAKPRVVPIEEIRALPVGSFVWTGKRWGLLLRHERAFVVLQTYLASPTHANSPLAHWSTGPYTWVIADSGEITDVAPPGDPRRCDIVELFLGTEIKGGEK